MLEGWRERVREAFKTEEQRHIKGIKAYLAYLLVGNTIFDTEGGLWELWNKILEEKGFKTVKTGGMDEEKGIEIGEEMDADDETLRLLRLDQRFRRLFEKAQSTFNQIFEGYSALALDKKKSNKKDLAFEWEKLVMAMIGPYKGYVLLSSAEQKALICDPEARVSQNPRDRDLRMVKSEFLIQFLQARKIEKPELWFCDLRKLKKTEIEEEQARGLMPLIGCLQAIVVSANTSQPWKEQERQGEGKWIRKLYFEVEAIP